MKKKIYLELGITLFIGFLLGFFVNSIMTDKRIKDFSMTKGELSFWRKTMNEIDASQEQKDLIIPIIRDYSEQTRDIVHKAWSELPSLWEEMESEIMVILNEEQQKKVKQIQDDRKLHIEERIKIKKMPMHKEQDQEHYNGKEGRHNKDNNGKYRQERPNHPEEDGDRRPMQGEKRRVDKNAHD